MIRLTALLLALVMVLGIVTGCKKKGTTNTAMVEFSDEYTLSPIYGGIKDINYFMHNPDRGFRTHNIIRVDEFTQYVGDYQKLMGEIADEFGIYFNNLKEPCSLSYCYIYLTKWHLEELPEEALAVVRAIFDYARIKKIKLLASFCYNNTIHESWVYVPSLKEELAKVCADEETILKHIDQLAPIISEYKDSIFHSHLQYIFILQQETEKINGLYWHDLILFSIYCSSQCSKRMT